MEAFMFKHLGVILSICVFYAGTVLAQGVTVGANVDAGAGEEGSIAINPTDPANVAASANFTRMYSLDGGVTWTNPSTDLWVSFDSNVGFDSLCHLYWQGLAFLPAGNRGIVIAQSIDKGQT